MRDEEETIDDYARKVFDDGPVSAFLPLQSFFQLRASFYGEKTK